MVGEKRKLKFEAGSDSLPHTTAQQKGLHMADEKDSTAEADTTEPTEETSASQEASAEEAGSSQSEDVATPTEPQEPVEAIYRVVHTVYVATCQSSAHPNSLWLGSEREQRSEAKDDAISHSESYPGHPVYVQSRDFRMS